MGATRSREELRRRMLGCWLGKAVGGTLGQPYEGNVQTHDAGPLALSYYDPVPESMEPNDDLDLQIIHAVLLRQRLEDGRAAIDCREMADLWRHVGMSPGEYGICKSNLALGLTPPATGDYDNPMRIGMGAAIRSELWACLAAGEPDRAARMAEHDACMDHADSGLDAARFLAALEATAFTEHRLENLLDGATALLPDGGELRGAIEDTRRWFAEGLDWRSIRTLIFDHHGRDDFTDVRINLPFIVLGLLNGWRGGRIEFGRAICTAVNCGMDTDCTGATTGAILGIIDPGCIEDRWLAPIGRQIVLSPSILDITPPPTIEALTDLVLDLRDALKGRMPPPLPPAQSVGHLAITAEAAIIDQLPSAETPVAWPDDARTVVLPGQWADWPAEPLRGRALLLRYRLTVDSDAGQPLRLVVASARARRAWWDGRCVIDAPAGPYVTVPHYGPHQQRSDLDTVPGEHELVVAFSGSASALEAGKRLEWYVALCRKNPHHGCPQNMPWAFRSADVPGR